MGKLTDKLEQVSQGGGSGFGFFGRARATERKSRPAALLVSLRTRDTAQAEAAAKNGADAIIISDWAPDADLSAIAGALAGSNAIWGVRVGPRAPSSLVLKPAREAGAAFALVDATAPAQALYEELDHFDRIVTVELPKDDLSQLTLRSQNLLPVQVGLLAETLSKSDIEGLTIGEFLQLKLVVESLRYPVLAALREAPEREALPILVRIGFAGLVLPGEGVAAETLGKQVQTLREDLEATPERREESGSSALLGGLIGMQGTGLQPEPRPEREPEREPEPPQPQPQQP